MHPFGGTHICPRCSKPVYLAEQTMGPGRKLYHKPCLACTSCNKRLDSYTLLEHNEQPYCKSCHIKNFGTRDLRHANLPYAPAPTDDAMSSSPTMSPQASNTVFPPAALLRPLSTGVGNANTSNQSPPLPRLRPNRSLATSPISPTFPRRLSPNTLYTVMDGKNETSTSASEVSTTDEGFEVQDSRIGNQNDFNIILEQDEIAEGTKSPTDDPEMSSYPSNTGRPGIGTLPRTIPLYLNGGRTSYRHHNSISVDSIPSNHSTPPTFFSNRSKEAEDISVNPSLAQPPGEQAKQFPFMNSLLPNATGTRYGIALGGNMAGGIGVQMTGTRQWGAGTPTCPRCMKSVYFAEQVKAVGKTYHKGCLRCTECNSSLDSNRLRDHNGEPFCVRCYSKLHGPQGGGYALLGKAGG